MRRVLVVGGAGYIGSHVCKYLAEKNIETVVFDNLTTGYREAVQWSELEIGDIRDADHLIKVLKTYSITEVVHCAALTSVSPDIS